MVFNIFFTSPYFNYFFLIFQTAYIIFSVVIVFKDLVKDIKYNFLGTSSTYIFVYLLLCLINLIQVANYSGRIIISSKEFYYWYLTSLVATYNGALFLIKNYKFKSSKTESLITILLMYFPFGIALWFSLNNYDYIWRYNLINPLDYFITLTARFFNSLKSKHLLVITKGLPLFILSILWFKSLCNTNLNSKHSYFHISANKPIFLFLLYQNLILFSPYFRLSFYSEIFVYFLATELIKLYFCISLLNFLICRKKSVGEKL